MHTKYADDSASISSISWGMFIFGTSPGNDIGPDMATENVPEFVSQPGSNTLLVVEGVPKTALRREMYARSSTQNRFSPAT
jgi:hypothetical protein